MNLAVLFVDSISFYKPVKTSGQITSYTLRSGPYKCSWQESPYYDTAGSPGGQNKQEDIFQANDVYCPYDIVMKPEDFIIVTTNQGLTKKGTAKGDAQQLSLLGVSYAMVKCIPMYVEPVIT